uniref:Dolichyl-diphosphooligosaccharide--protein glycosyltransferase subunit 1 n=1 Tax=Ananas comosus var. bracteatus TaxID=296719 RepID=A0A6V7PWX3_ANACO|nr:unnamed protein product [Ananas comosus var. bracteatus]
MDMLAVFAHSLTPFPEEITQADVQLLVYQDSAYYLSPYAVKVQSLGIRLPNGRVESYTKIDYQMRTNIRGTSSFSLLTALLPPRAHSIYYRDEIGNISTSTLWADSRKVVLPEGSKDISASAPFHTKQSEEVKYSHLDIVGRPVVVLEKTNVVPEHNLYFQVFYRFSNLSLLREPLMLASGFFLLFVACIVYMHTDMAISKTSASYLAKLQWDEPRLFVGRGMHESSFSLLMYTLFWFVLILTKLAFSYYVEIKPLVGPTQDIMRIPITTFQWHEFFPRAKTMLVL